jgi:hypothetical protein
MSLYETGDAYSKRLVLSNAKRFGDQGLDLLQRGLKDNSQWVREKANDEIRKWRLHLNAKSRRN